LRQAIKAIVVNSHSERDLVNRLEELVRQEISAALTVGEELSMPVPDIGGEG
jgi:hypothetical protein